MHCMKNRILIYGVVATIIFIMIVCVTVVMQFFSLDRTNIVFLDVGQGDAILISHGTDQILIDGGPDGTLLLEELSEYMPFWDRTIEIVVATHPDSDHIDGLVSVFESYHIKQLWYTNADKNTATYKKLLQCANNEDGLEKLHVFHGSQAMIGDGILKVIYPYNSDVSDFDDVNTASIVALFEIGDEIFYLGGDITTEFEDDLLVGESVTVLKASHHGSSTSTSEFFLNKTRPRDMIISSGKSNRYGHPHDEVLMRAYRARAQVFRTDQFGSIKYLCQRDDCDMLYK